MLSTTCRNHCKSIGNLLIHFLIAAGTFINLMEHLTIFDKQYPFSTASGLDGMCYHQNRLAFLVNYLKHR